jgi:hypothetical protein
MNLPRSLLALVVACAAFLCSGAPASARTAPPPPPFRVLVVDGLSQSQLRHLASRGAVGLLVPGVGPTTNRRQALAAMIRGAQMNARLGGVPSGPPLLAPSFVSGTPTSTGVIVVALPPRGVPGANDRRYPIAVIGRGFRGLLRSPTTRIDGLVSIVDIAPTALGHRRGALSSVDSARPVESLASLDRQIHANNRLKLPALIVVACAVALLAAMRRRAAMTAVPAGLLVSILLGAAQVSSEPLILAVLMVGTIGGGVWLGKVCRTDGRLLALIVGVLVVHLLLFAVRPEWVAVTPLGPTQNSRFWGIGNQLETLLLAPLLAGAVLAGRQFGRVGFTAFALLALVLVTDNRFGSDGGGAIVLGVAFAFLGARMMRLGLRGFVLLLLVTATVVLAVVAVNLQMPGPNHLRSAFGHGPAGLLDVARNRVPLAYLPALHNWPLVLPLALWFVAALLIAIRASRRPVTRDVVLALGIAIGTSLLVNDSATYELVGGVASLAGVARFSPSFEGRRVPALARVPLGVQPLPSEASSGSPQRRT